MRHVNQEEYLKEYRDKYFGPISKGIETVTGLATGATAEVPPLAAAVAAAGTALEWSSEKIFDYFTRGHRYEEGVWYDTPSGIPGSTKPVQDPFMDKKININKDIQKLEKIRPLVTPLQTPQQVRRFDRADYGNEQPSILIYNDRKIHNKQPHPSSRPLGNAAIPYVSQGFPRR